MRIVNRALAFVLALALVAAGVIVVVEVAAHALNHAPVIVHWPVWSHWAQRTTWNRAVIKVCSILLILAGALLLVAELTPRRARRVPLTSDTAATDTAITRHGLAGGLQAAALDVDGVTAAKVSVRARKVTVAAQSAARDKAGAQALHQPVTDAVQERLDRLGLRRPPRLAVHVTTGGS